MVGFVVIIETDSWILSHASSLIAVTWNVTCTYSQFLAQKTPTCCVSLSSFYNDTIVPCPTCTCGCPNNITQPGSCVECVFPSNIILIYLAFVFFTL